MENLSEQAKRKMRYDATCKEVLSEKSMIACILQTCVEEFKGCSIKDIARHYIQGMPEVGTVVGQLPATEVASLRESFDTSICLDRPGLLHSQSCEVQQRSGNSQSH